MNDSAGEWPVCRSKETKGRARMPTRDDYKIVEAREGILLKDAEDFHP